MPQHILTINTGSSSLKAAVYDRDGGDAPVATGRVERIGTASATAITRQGGGDHSERLAVADHAGALDYLLPRLVPASDAIVAVVHRVVHGGARHRDPEQVTD